MALEKIVRLRTLVIGMSTGIICGITTALVLKEHGVKNQYELYNTAIKAFNHVYL